MMLGIRERRYVVRYAIVVAALGALDCNGDQFQPDAGDAGQDGPIIIGGGGDGGDAGDATVATTYNAVGSASFWSLFDTTNVQTAAGGYAGATFDGKYVYFAPANGPIAMRHDTTSDLGTLAAWEAFDVTTIPGGAFGYAGAAFDGRYVYFAPDVAGGSAFGKVARYDTQASFTTSGSWTLFDVTTVAAAAKGFVGVVFDGRYLYFVPNANGGATFARYDTQATINAGSSWQTFDVSTVASGASGFAGGAFDGRYVYAAPQDGTLVARYDTQAGFTTGASWTVFDPSTVDPNAKGFFGIVFDARYLYFVPINKTGTTARYDTQGSFTTAGSWTTFALTNVSANTVAFINGGFDGRNVYFNPFNNPNVTDAGTNLDGLLVRYNTQAGFATAGSWSTFDLTSLNAGAVGMGSSVFDGRHLYVAGLFSNFVARFDAKSPASMPALPAFHGSFF